MSDLIARYRRNYRLPDDQEITAEQIHRHFELERQLTQELLASTPETRAETFERCYSTLYRELPWLNKPDSEQTLADWGVLIGPPPKHVYEIGSGQGGLARALVEAGYEVEATEVTRERGDWDGAPGLHWSQTDGVHLADWAPQRNYDAVISTQVVEHLHPDDIVPHLRGVLAILKPGGRYAMRTPHDIQGPLDISLVFQLDRAVGMHLHEYTYRELALRMRQAGFDRVAAPVGLPARLGPWAERLGRLSVLYLAYLVAIERLLAPLPRRRQRLLVQRVLRMPLFRRDVTLVGFKAE